MRGVFVSIEGPEGSGKTTHAARLEQRLRERGHDVVRVREPGGTQTGEAIRGILQHDQVDEPIFPETETLLFAACRAQLVRQVILPALSRGCCVVSDRFADSTTAYQGYGRGFGAETVMAVNAFAVNGAEPDLTLLLDLSVQEGFRRLADRSARSGVALDRMERAGLEFHERVREGYLELARRWPARFRVIDSDRPLDEVAAEAWRETELLLQRHGAEP